MYELVGGYDSRNGAVRQLQSDPEHAALDAMIARARAAMSEVAGYDQARIDRLCQALGWATANENDLQPHRRHEHRGEPPR